jgi:choice-of-anchor A domain-containing protein
VIGLGLVPPASAAAIAWPPGFGPCAGPSCPSGPYPDPGNGPITFHDDAINVFTGGDFSAVNGAAETEGRVVAIGSVDIDSNPVSVPRYNIGVVGVGSRVTPSPGQVALAVGGDISVVPQQILEVGPSDGLIVNYAGTRTGSIDAAVVQQTPMAVGAYDDVSAQLMAISQCINDPTVRTGTTGTATNTGSTVTFTGDDTSPLQIFDVDFPIGTTSSAEGLVFTGIPPGGTVIINDTNGLVNTFTGGNGSGQGPPDSIRQRLMWNFPTESTVTLNGSAQFQGSVLVGSAASTTTDSYPGIDGRTYTVGNLVQTSTSGGGTEIHAYPFDGELPECPTDVTTTTTTTPTSTTTTAPDTSTTTTTSMSTSTTTSSPNTAGVLTHSSSSGGTGATNPSGRTASGALATTGFAAETAAEIALGLLVLGVLLILVSRRLA